MVRIIRNIVMLLLGLLVIAAAIIWWMLQQSLPVLQGVQPAALKSAVTVSRDERGYLTIRATNQADAVYSLGFSHAQDRFFQMDLLRRNAAGELAELFGPAALPTDKERRIHRFRDRAELILANLPKADQQLLQRYTDGVNAGLNRLGMPPFEYLLLTSRPRAWQSTDSLLVIFSMYLDLQETLGSDELAQGLLKQQVPADWYQFLTQHSANWQAAIDDSLVSAIPMPDSPYPAWLKTPPATTCQHCDPLQRIPNDSRDIGSNNFAVAASHSKAGRAIVADDMHLSVRVPGIWYKAQLIYGEDQQQVSVAGVSLPGAPAIVAGSNGHIAWGYTNSTADWNDVIKLELDDSGKKYKTPSGWQEFSYNNEVIKIKGQPDLVLLMKETQWGPLLPAPFTGYALRWVAHDKEAVNLELNRLAEQTSVAAALQHASKMGIPAQNLLVADRKGQIGWTIAGPMPLRQSRDWDVPQDWSDGQQYWDGYRSAADYPKVDDKALLWTANARTVGNDQLAKLGNGGYDLGARGKQIADRLRTQAQHDEQSLHAIQLDHEALFLKPWRELLLAVLTADFVKRNQLQHYRQAVDTDSHAASPDSTGYPLVRAFRDKTLTLLFAPMAAQLEQQQLSIRDLKWSVETPGWAMLQARRPDTLPASFNSWDALLQQAVLDSKQELQAKVTAGQPLNWGALNTGDFRHPLTQVLEVLSPWLNMPKTPMAGDRHMPRVQMPVHGQSERMVVAPGHEQDGILVVPAGQSGHPLSEFYRADHDAWLNEKPLGFLPGPEKYQLILQPQG